MKGKKKERNLQYNTRSLYCNIVIDVPQTTIRVGEMIQTSYNYLLFWLSKSLLGELRMYNQKNRTSVKVDWTNT